MTCAQCRECLERWTGSQTCTGSICFIALKTDQESADRGCYNSAFVINAQCNRTTMESDGTRVYQWCCSESDLCNANNTLSNIRDFLIPTPTPTLTTAVTSSTNATSSTGRQHNVFM